MAKLTKDFITNDFVPALRSGAYTQIEGQLRDAETNCFCATGVACDLLTQIDPNRYEWDDEGYFLIHRNPDELDDWTRRDYEQAVALDDPYAESILTAAWEADSPIDLNALTGSQFWEHIIQMNDEGNTFDEIADWIENPATMRRYHLA